MQRDMMCRVLSGVLVLASSAGYPGFPRFCNWHPGLCLHGYLSLTVVKRGHEIFPLTLLNCEERETMNHGSGEGEHMTPNR
jgi:hypothetical protein